MWWSKEELVIERARRFTPCLQRLPCELFIWLCHGRGAEDWRATMTEQNLWEWEWCMMGKEWVPESGLTPALQELCELWPITYISTLVCSLKRSDVWSCCWEFCCYYYSDNDYCQGALVNKNKMWKAFFISQSFLPYLAFLFRCLYLLLVWQPYFSALTTKGGRCYSSHFPCILSLVSRSLWLKAPAVTFISSLWKWFSTQMTNEGKKN